MSHNQLLVTVVAAGSCRVELLRWTPAPGTSESTFTLTQTVKQTIFNQVNSEIHMVLHVHKLHISPLTIHHVTHSVLLW